MKASRLAGLAALVAMLVAASLAATTHASSANGVASAAAGQQAAGSVQISYAVKRFVTRGGRLFARGQVIATVRTDSGTRVERKNFQARVIRTSTRSARMQSASAICDVLNLTLGPLRLELLGLIIELDTVVLRITADSEGGLLGQLLCGLAGGPVATPKVAAALTRKARTSGLAAGKLATEPQALTLPGLPPVPEGVCTVLDLVLGPLHLELLGLIVDLNQLHLRITADPQGGLLGSLLCPGIAGQPA